MPIHTGAERDLRFVFCAAAICSMLENWSGMDKENVKKYILNCQVRKALALLFCCLLSAFVLPFYSDYLIVHINTVIYILVNLDFFAVI